MSREHGNAERAAKRRALKQIDMIVERAITLESALRKNASVYGSDGRSLADMVNVLTENLAILETLGDVREWAKADEQEADGEATGL